ncbi:nucleoside phosphorylase [Haploplasma axanthum]|uniref:Uridine phosphorylase n=1 Tax=Haploplasma axanthum TaxID=29552 RepID=A0A449BFK9_HAPAX|nr:nucleoside phosphorylase [Haploplasma axanthum]VEU81247.1 Purine nucleoside phosphorylase deoD-type [Haploplasma axanthum]
MITSSYRDSNEILKVSDVATKYPKSFKTIIITFQAKVKTKLIEMNLINELPNIEIGSSSGKFPVYEVVGFEDIIFYFSPIGAPITVGILEEIVYTFDIKNVVLYGACGVLDKAITSGKIVIPTKAYRDEGTSYHYMPASDFVDIYEHDKISNIFAAAGISYVKGYTWTTDAFYRETMEIFLERKKQGCIVVEMEISAVAAFAKLRGVNFYPFVYAADNLDSSNWDKRILGSLDIDSRVNYFLVARLLASKLS